MNTWKRPLSNPRTNPQSIIEENWYQSSLPVPSNGQPLAAKDDGHPLSTLIMPKPLASSDTSRPIRARRGAATVEFAVCLPILVLIVIGSIEASSMLFLRQAMVQASYEGAKVASRPTGDNTATINAVNSVANGRNLSGIQITLDPPDVTTAKPGELITVSVSVPGDANSILPFGPFQGRTVSASAVMARE